MTRQLWLTPGSAATTWLSVRMLSQVEASLEKHSLTEFQSDLVEIYSAKYLCPQYEQRATDNLRSSILGD